MKKILSAAFAALLFLCATGASAQSSIQDGDRIASVFANWRASIVSGNASTGSQTITIAPALIQLPDGRSIPTASLTAPLTVDMANAANSETVIPTTVSCNQSAGGQIGGNCTVTASFNNTHGAGINNVSSGTFGLQEAINDAVGYNGAAITSSQGGSVLIDKSWGGTTAQINGTATSGSNVTVFPMVTIVDKRTGIPIYWNPTPTGAALAVPTTLTAQAACDASHQTCSDANVAGSASWGGTVFAAVACVDIMGNEGPPSLTASWTSVASKAINIASPAASAGCVGWVPYLSLSGGTYAQAYQIPVTSSVCTMTTLETVIPACAIANATYGQAASTFGITALFTKGGAQITGFPVNTGLHFTQLGSTAMTLASQTPISNSSVTYAYAPSNRVGNCGISSANVTNYAAAGSSATTIPNSVATWSIPANCFNFVGAEFRVSGKFTYTDGGDTSTHVFVKWDAAGTNTTTVPTSLCDILDTATGPGAAYNATYTCTVRISTTGATGTALVNGYSTQNLAAGATTLVRNGADIAVAASGSINLTVPARVTVLFEGIGATNNPGAQGLEATLETLN